MDLISTANRRWASGVASAACAALIWSSWTVVSKVGVSAHIDPLNLAAIRFATSGLIAMPVVAYLKPYRSISIIRVAVLAATGGVPYVLLLYHGFVYAPASHGAVLVNGVVPALVLLLRCLLSMSRPSLYELAGSCTVVCGVSLVFAGSNQARGASVVGDLLFLAAACLFALFIVLSSRWKCTPSQVLMSLSLTGAVTYLPFWWVSSTSRLSHVDYSSLLLQVMYQGVLAPVVGMLLISWASVLAGPTIVATILSSVPALSALLSWLWLAEPIAAINWIGICVATVGLLLIVSPKQARPGPATAVGAARP
jgi:drug/metabolite transporter (DMT)-like permease